MIQIREAKAEDQNEVARLIEQLEEAPVHREALNAVYQENLNNPQIAYQIALSEGKICGLSACIFKSCFITRRRLPRFRNWLSMKNAAVRAWASCYLGRRKKLRQRQAVRSWNVRAINAGLPAMSFIKSRE